MRRPALKSQCDRTSHALDPALLSAHGLGMGQDFLWAEPERFHLVLAMQLRQVVVVRRIHVFRFSVR